MTLILYGKKVRDEIAKTLRVTIEAFSSKVTLAIMQIGARQESDAYIARKKAFAKSVGASVLHVRLPESVLESEIISRIQKLNAD